MWGRKLSISVIASALVVLAILGTFDNVGRQYTEAGLKRALVTFGVARGLNAAISVAQGTQVAMEPAGVGVIFAPGQILDPVNDLIERFSWVMLVSSTSLGLQGLLLKVFAAPAFTLLLALSVAGALVLFWWRAPVPAALRRLVFRLAAVLLLLRFVIPVMAIGTEAFYHYFLEPEYRASTAYLSETQETIGGLNPPTAKLEEEGKRSWYERLQDDVKGMLSAMDVSKHVASLQAAVHHVSEHIINLIVVFVLQTVLLPLLFLWLSLKSGRAIFQLRWSGT
ncbi:MAG: hypothetical protein R6X06_03610 [Gammaproteobacteria bacterium]